MINNKHIYLVASYVQRPRNPKLTHIKGYIKDPANLRWDESFTVTRGVKKRDLNAQILLDLTDKRVEKDSFGSNKTFDDIFHYFFLNYHKQLAPVMSQIDPDYLKQVAERIEQDMKSATEPEVQDAEIKEVVMKRFKLSESGARGWFIGDFPEAVFRTRDFEVNWQTNPRGHSTSHYHKVVHEIQLITRGRMLVNGEIYEAGDIFIFEPGDLCQIEFLEETDTVAVKVPSVPDDKYLL